MTPNTRRALLVGVTLAVLLAVLVGRSFMYVVDERQMALVLQFGRPVQERTKPGLYFKLPMVQEVLHLPKTLQFWSGADDVLVDLPTADGKKIEVTPWAVWRITNPTQFVTVLRTVDIAEERVRTFVRSAVRDVITSHTLAEAVRSTNRPLTYSFQLEELQEPGDERRAAAVDAAQQGTADEVKRGREKLVAQIRARAIAHLRQSAAKAQGGRGVELVDVGISRIEFVPTVQQAAFNRQIAFMESIASRYTNEGVRRKQEILNRTNAEVQRIEGEGKQRANIIRGQVDAEIIEAYAQAIGETGDFFSFVRTLDVYGSALAGRTRLILTTDSDLFRLLKNRETTTAAEPGTVAPLDAAPAAAKP